MTAGNPIRRNNPSHTKFKEKGDDIFIAVTKITQLPAMMEKKAIA